MVTRSLVPALLIGVMVLAGCGGGSDAGSSPEPDEPTSAPPTAQACLEGATDCEDMPSTPPPGAPQGGDDSAIDEAAIIAEAEALLGQPEDDVVEGADDVRVGRHGDEQMALTEDYVIGRKTVETDDDGSGVYRVVEVTVELTEGPHTVTAE